MKNLILILSLLVVSCSSSPAPQKNATQFLPKNGTVVKTHTWNDKKLSQDTSTKLCHILVKYQSTFKNVSRDIRKTDTDSGEVMMSLAPSRYFGFKNMDNKVSIELYKFSTNNEVVQCVVHEQNKNENYFVSSDKSFIQNLKNIKEIK